MIDLPPPEMFLKSLRPEEPLPPPIIPEYDRESARQKDRDDLAAANARIVAEGQQS